MLGVNGSGAISSYGQLIERHTPLSSDSYLDREPHDLATIVKSSNYPYPSQQSTRIGLLKQADVYLQKFIKYPHLGYYHSYAELLHAAILESDPNVTKFVPQPFKFRIGKNVYIPDCYVVFLNHKLIIELRPRSEFRSDWLSPVSKCARKYGMEFIVISNEDVLKMEVKARNWLTICQTLIHANNFNTDQLENEILIDIHKNGNYIMRKIKDIEDEHERYLTNAALLKLLHKGEITANIESNWLSYDTEFTV